MPGVDLVVESPLLHTPRVMQLSAMYDVPLQERTRVEWHGTLDVDDDEWNVGMIVGPSGSGKTQIAQSIWKQMPAFQWEAASVIDDFGTAHGIEEIARICQAVGFNTIPSWMKPFVVLSNGERFRVDLARRLLTLPDPIVVDEFSSVVDRQVAQIASYAVAKYVRKYQRRFIAISCHYDIIDWLDPDWIFEPATMKLSRRCLRRSRPELHIEITRVPYEAWFMFAPFHYLTRELHRAARCFCLFLSDRAAAFAAMLHRPHSRSHDIMGLSRLVTLPDFQGLGLAFILTDALAAAYKTCGKRFHTYPAHPSLVRSFARSPKWMMCKASSYSRRQSLTSTIHGRMGGRPCAVFEYVGAAMADASQARALIEQSI